MSLTSSLRKVKQDILIVFHAREILIPEDRSHESSSPVEIHQQCFSLAKLQQSS